MTLRLASAAWDHRMDLDGHLASTGSPLGLGDLPLNRGVAFTWWWLVRDADESQKAKQRARLWTPPKVDSPIPAESPWSAENESKAFSALKAATGS